MTNVRNRSLPENRSQKSKKKISFSIGIIKTTKTSSTKATLKEFPRSINNITHPNAPDGKRSRMHDSEQALRDAASTPLPISITDNLSPPYPISDNLSPVSNLDLLIYTNKEKVPYWVLVTRTQNNTSSEESRVRLSDIAVGIILAKAKFLFVKIEQQSFNSVFSSLVSKLLTACSRKGFRRQI